MEVCTVASRTGPAPPAPVQSARLLTLSSPAAAGSLTPRIWAQVASRSVRHTVWSTTDAAGMRAGQRSSRGMRCPPS